MVTKFLGAVQQKLDTKEINCEFELNKKFKILQLNFKYSDMHKNKYLYRFLEGVIFIIKSFIYTHIN